MSKKVRSHYKQTEKGVQKRGSSKVTHALKARSPIGVEKVKVKQKRKFSVRKPWEKDRPKTYATTLEVTPEYAQALAQINDEIIEIDKEINSYRRRGESPPGALLEEKSKFKQQIRALRRQVQEELDSHPINNLEIKENLSTSEIIDVVEDRQKAIIKEKIENLARETKDLKSGSKSRKQAKEKKEFEEARKKFQTTDKTKMGSAGIGIIFSTRKDVALNAIFKDKVATKAISLNELAGTHLWNINQLAVELRNEPQWNSITIGNLENQLRAAGLTDANVANIPKDNFIAFTTTRGGRLGAGVEKTKRDAIKSASSSFK